MAGGHIVAAGMIMAAVLWFRRSQAKQARKSLRHARVDCWRSRAALQSYVACSD